MPEMDGIEATKLIRRQSENGNQQKFGFPFMVTYFELVKIFALTASTLAEDRQRCEQAGMTGYVLFS